MQLNREELLRAYRTMRLIRDFEERLHVEFATGEIPGFVHLYAGEEASAVGVCMHLGDKDHIVSTHRGHGHCIAKGCNVDGMMSEIYGKRTVSAVAVRDLTWPSTLFKRRRADPVRTLIATNDLRTRAASTGGATWGDPNRRAVQREQTPSVATEGVRS